MSALQAAGAVGRRGGLLGAFPAGWALPVSGFSSALFGPHLPFLWGGIGTLNDLLCLLLESLRSKTVLEIKRRDGVFLSLSGELPQMC